MNRSRRLLICAVLGAAMCNAALAEEQASVMLNYNGKMTLSDSAHVYGSSGANETVRIEGTPDLKLDASVDRVEFDANWDDYQYQVEGTVIRVYQGAKPVCEFDGLNNPVTLAFTGGSATLTLSGMDQATLGSADLPETKSSISNPGLDASDPSPTKNQAAQKLVYRFPTTPFTLDKIEGGYKISDTWEVGTPGGGVDSMRNPHYVFSLTKAGPLTVTLETPQGNMSGVVLSIIDTNNFNHISNKVTSNTWLDLPEMEPGQYMIVAHPRYGMPNPIPIKIEIKGAIDENIIKLGSDTKVVNSNWRSSGGVDGQFGGTTESYRNHRYTLEVEKDTFLDVQLTSPDKLLALTLRQLNNPTFTPKISVDKWATTLGAYSLVTPGTYEIIAGTYYVGATTNYQLNVNGHFKNLTRTESDFESITHLSCDADSATTKFEVEVTELSILDIELKGHYKSSILVKDYLDLTADGGYAYISHPTYTITRVAPKLTPGKYTVETYCTGPWSMTVDGKFTNWQQL